MLYLLNPILCLALLCYSVKRREFRYTIIALLTLLYYVFSYLQTGIDLLDNSQIYGFLQRLTLTVLAIYSIVAAKKSIDKKFDIPVAVFSCVACVFRFIRTYFFRSFTVKLKMDAAATQMLYEKFTLYYVPIDSVVNISLMIMLFCIAWKLRRKKTING